MYFPSLNFCDIYYVKKTCVQTFHVNIAWLFMPNREVKVIVFLVESDIMYDMEYGRKKYKTDFTLGQKRSTNERIKVHN